MRAAAGFALLLTTGALAWAQRDWVSEPQRVHRCLQAKQGTLKIDPRLNPFYLRGDFDGDGKPDYAVLVVEKATAKHGIAICRSGAPELYLYGAGTKAKFGDEEFDDISFDEWEVYAKGPVERGVTDEPPPTLTGEAILITVEESASGLIYWDGKRFRWYQQAD